MSYQELIDTAQALIAVNKGLLAMDESTGTCNKRFAALGIPQTEDARRSYRELILTTPGLSESISGVILYDETIRQNKKDGTPFLKLIVDANIIPGIKVDTGAKSLAGFSRETVTEGLDGLRERLAEYSSMGARFAKWRAVFTAGNGIPSRGCIEANAQALARYAALCQEAGVDPIVEPEILMDGSHTMKQCSEVSEGVLRTVFIQLFTQRVKLEGMILKPNMVLPGLMCPQQETDDRVADATVECLLRGVPAAVPGIAFLSGGQPGQLASARLNAMNLRWKCDYLGPWLSHLPVAFSNPHWRFGGARKFTFRRRSGLCITVPSATRQRAVEHTTLKWIRVVRQTELLGGTTVTAFESFKGRRHPNQRAESYQL